MDRVARKASDPVDTILRKGRRGKVNGKHQRDSGDEAELPCFPCFRQSYGVQIHGNSVRFLVSGLAVIGAGRRYEADDACSGRIAAERLHDATSTTCIMPSSS